MLRITTGTDTSSIQALISAPEYKGASRASTKAENKTSEAAAGSQPESSTSKAAAVPQPANPFVEARIISLLMAPFQQNDTPEQKALYMTEEKQSRFRERLERGDRGALKKAYCFSLVNEKNRARLTEFLNVKGNGSYRLTFRLAQGMAALHRAGQYTESRLDLLGRFPEEAFFISGLYTKPRYARLRECVGDQPDEFLRQGTDQVDTVASALNLLAENVTPPNYQKYKMLLVRHRLHASALSSTIIDLLDANLPRQALKKTILFLRKNLQFLDPLQADHLLFRFINAGLTSSFHLSRLVYLIQLMPETLEGSTKLRIAHIIGKLSGIRLLTNDNWNRIFQCKEFLRETMEAIERTPDINQEHLNALFAENLAKRREKELRVRAAVRPHLCLFDPDIPSSSHLAFDDAPLEIICSYR